MNRKPSTRNGQNRAWVTLDKQQLRRVQGGLKNVQVTSMDVKSTSSSSYYQIELEKVRVSSYSFSA